MIAKNCDGKVPQPGALSGDDEALLGAAGALLAEVRAEMDRQQFHNALTKVWEVVGDANRYIDHAAPWTLRKTDPARMATVLYALAEAIRRLAILCQRSEEHTSELQSLLRISYAVFCLNKKQVTHTTHEC